MMPNIGELLVQVAREAERLKIENEQLRAELERLTAELNKLRK